MYSVHHHLITTIPITITITIIRVESPLRLMWNPTWCRWTTWMTKHEPKGCCPSVLCVCGCVSSFFCQCPHPSTHTNLCWGVNRYRLHTQHIKEFSIMWARLEQWVWVCVYECECVWVWVSVKGRRISLWTATSENEFNAAICDRGEDWMDSLSGDGDGRWR